MWILFSPEYIEYTILGIVLLPGLIFAIYTSTKVNTTFSKYSTVLASKDLTGAMVAKKIMEAKGIFDVTIVKSENTELVDNFNPETKVVTLSKKVYDGTSIASLGVAAHEIGHVIQHAEGYTPIKIRSVLAKTSTIFSYLVWPLIVVGIVLDFAYIGGVFGKTFLWCGVAFFGLSLVFSLVTLPVELDASKRALDLLVQTDCLDDTEVLGAKKVLKSAAMTYVAAIVVSLLQLLRFLLYFVLSSKRRR